MQKAEAASVKASGSSGTVHAEGLAQLQPVLQAAKLQLEAQLGAETLQKAAASCKTLADLPRLEAAILSARKTNCQDADLLR